MKVITYPRGCDKVHENARTSAKRRHTGEGNRRQDASANSRRSAKVGIWRG